MHLFKPPAKLAMLIVLSLLLLCCGVGNVHCSTVHENNKDFLSLLEFKRGISDPKGALSNWINSTHFCRWNGVKCTTMRPLRVMNLNLTGQSLAGNISSSLDNLTFLNYFDLSNNNLVGPIPPLGHLKQLEYLFLNNNNLSGTIPDALANCSNLSSLDLSSNFLVGSIPPKLGLLSNLRYLNFKSNQLEGSIPDKFGQLVNLTSLLLDENRLSGEIPPAIFRLSSLEYLGLGYNMLRMALPPNMGDLFPNLEELALQNNFFEGLIPASLGNATRLRVIDLSFNDFTGQIPFFGKLSNLKFLSLQSNQLVARDDKSWEFLNALGNCKSLNTLSFAENNLQGSLPPSIGNLSSTSLQHLLFGRNSLSGQIPESIGKLSALIRLGLNDNFFSGPIDGWLENLKNLQVLLLNSNNFTGQIPFSIDKLTRLTELYLHENEFMGPIPASLGRLPLQKLNLSYNNLQGYIPQNFGSLQLINLDLSHNNLEGSTTQVGNLDKISTLDLSWNKFTGRIPDSLGLCYDLESIKMEQNSLTGSIPSTFCNLTMLRLLNLSHNNLSGTIPQALNVLGSLINLDLSYNNLHGQVPRNGVFENATAVSLEGNQGLCGGAMDLRMPSCTAVSKKTDTGYYLTRVLLPILGFMSPILLVYFFFLVKKMRAPRTYPSLNSPGDNFIKISYNDLAQATSNFSESNLFGRGSYGSVYRGKLKGFKMEVAVKVFDLDMGGAEKNFLKECEVLRSIQHRNILPILTACSTEDNTHSVFKALVYSFMANGSLDRWLHHKGDRKSHKPLSFTQRLSISVNIADALDYLHHDCGRPTIHCDLKPSNVLLDDNMNALLADFSIASFYHDSSSIPTGPISSSFGMKGTIGYIAPEYAGGGRHASTSDDVYAFGIILLEMMTGRRPTDPIFKDGVGIVDFVNSNFPHQIFQVLDAPLIEECKGFRQAKMASENAVQQCLVSLLQVALSCTNPIPSERMTMKETASRMHAIQTSHMSIGKAKQYASLDLG